MATRFTQIDYDRQMVLILTEHGAPGTMEYYDQSVVTVRLPLDDARTD